MNILFLSNIPSPYRIDFFNELGKYTNLTVIFEAKKVKNINFNWNIESIKNFKVIFLNEGEINEKKITWTILKYIKKNQFDHIIVTNYAYFTEMIALMKLKFFRIPYFLEIDGGLIKEENILKKMLKTFLISNAKGYFSPSRSSDEFLLYFGARLNRIHRYRFTSLYSNQILEGKLNYPIKQKIKTQLGITSERVILGVGQLINRKGFDTLLKASKNLKDDISIYIVGGGNKSIYSNLIDNLNLKNINFIEFINQEELSNYYKAADIFVLPTREDIWGLVINEAMSFGLPVVTTNKCGAGLELINNEENGFLVNPDDYDDLRYKIVRILEKEELMNQMSKNNLRKIKEYTIENMVKSHMEIFKSQN